METLPALPAKIVPEVVDETGKKVLRPDILQMVTQMAQLAQLARIRKSLEKEHFEGKKDSRTLNATDQLQWIDLIDHFPNKPWATASFFNDGPNRAYISFDALDWTPLNRGDRFPPDFTKADERIGLIYYICDPGNTASVRAVGKY